jgi:hypothetical protein
LSNASGTGSTNIASGFKANSSGDHSDNVALGNMATSAGNNSSNLAGGDQAKAGGNGSANTAYGSHSDASGDGGSNVAIGSRAVAKGVGTQNSAVGSNSLASGDMASAFGAGAQAAFLNSAAFGAGAIVTRINQQVFGTGTNTYTFPGLPSAASTAALSGPTALVVTDASGNLAAVTVKGLSSASFVRNGVLTLGTSDTRKAFTGVAMAFAMVGSPTVMPNERIALSVNWGTYEGANGSAVSAAMRIYRSVQLNGSFAFGFTDNTPGGRVGLRFGF